ncbi:MAG: hypothetical protein IJO13_02120 [Lachnospiraceae bacterium]|nr:hypothetical protein [Lachnospiraceae bacterium]
MARYHETDFYPWEKPLMEELKKEGKFIYVLIDTGGTNYQICKGGFCNRFGYMITDEKLPLNEDDYIDGKEFHKLDWTPDYTLKRTKRDLSEEIEKSKETYERNQKEQEKKWKKYEPYYNLSLEIERKYKFQSYRRHSDPDHYGKTTPYYEDNKEIVLQYVRIEPKTPENEQMIGYFLLQDNKMITESKLVTVKRNCSINAIFKAIEKQENLIRIKGEK